MEFPGKRFIQNPMIDLYYEIDIAAAPEVIWPWLRQVGYHRAGWYIDTWWDEFEQKYFWPMLVPKDARGTFKPAANELIEEYQNIKVGDIIPDGPPGSAYYEVVQLEENHLLLLYATSHFKYMAPQFVYKTRFAPKGAFCWAFILHQLDANRSKLISWWQVEASPKFMFYLYKPLLVIADRLHQKEILKGVKRRVERARTT